MVYVHFTSWEHCFFVVFFFFSYLNIYRLNFTSQQTPILGSKYPFLLRKTYFSLWKNHIQTKHQSHWNFPLASFPFVYLIRLLHTFDWQFYSSLFTFILPFNCYCAHGWIVMRQWSYFFLPIFTCLQNQNGGLASKLLLLSKWRFF